MYKLEEHRPVLEKPLFTKSLQRNIMLKTSFFGYAHHEILTDSSGKPVDYRFLFVNLGFEKMTGLKAKYYWENC